MKGHAVNMLRPICKEMSLARNIQVVPVTADPSSVTYSITFDVVLDRNVWKALSEEAGKQGQRVVSMLRRYAAKALRRHLAADDDKSAPAGESNSKPIGCRADKIAARYGE